MAQPKGRESQTGGLPIVERPVEVPQKLEDAARTKGWPDGLLRRALDLRVRRDLGRDGRLDAGPEEVEAAARASRAHGFIEELPAKYETEVGERGVKLSVGQQQRISIARAFLKDAPVLLLDEPTSALDLRTEADFLEGLADLMAGRTVFIVAHRLSTIRNVDRIYFLEAGRIAEQGSHDDLMKAQGRYYELFMRQFGSGSHEPAVV